MVKTRQERVIAIEIYLFVSFAGPFDLDTATFRMIGPLLQALLIHHFMILDIMTGRHGVPIPREGSRRPQVMHWQ